MTLLYGTIIYVLTIGKLLLWAFFVHDQVEMRISYMNKWRYLNYVSYVAMTNSLCGS